jgi:hypothetical protein
MRTQLCFNREDDRLPRCEPAAIGAFKVAYRGVGRADAHAQRNAARLLDAVAALGGTAHGDEVRFEAGFQTRDVCTAPIVLNVPACTRGRGPRSCKGVARILTDTTDPSGQRRDRDVVALQCLPAR